MKRALPGVLVLTFVFGGNEISAAAKAGTVVGWGWNNAPGEIVGVPSVGIVSGPVFISGRELTNAVAISAGFSHSLAVLSDGTVAGWGANDAGQAVGYRTATPSTNGVVMLDGHVLTNVVAVACGGSDSFALKSDGTVVGWGNGGLPVDVRTRNDFIGISASSYHCLFLHRDGTVNGLGQYSRVPQTLSNVVAVSANPYFVAWDLALLRDGTVAEWNTRAPQIGGPLLTVTNEDSGEASQEYERQDYRLVEGLSNVISVACGSDENLALKSDGTVYEWRFVGSSNGLIVHSAGSGLVQLNGQLLTNITAITAATEQFSRSAFALKRDGSLVRWGVTPDYSLDPPHALSNVVAISAGYGYCLAITTSTNLDNLKK